jgi:protein-S-isoprenylcysteine O-methyltransferase Ste14
MSAKNRLVLFSITLISVATYAVLTVWGYGGVGGYFADPARTGLIVVLVVLTIIALMTNSSGLGAGVREDTSNRWVLLPLIFASFVSAWACPFLDGRNELVFGSEATRWVGVGLCFVGGILRLIPVFELGNRFSGLVAIQPGHTLKTDGVYRFIRHPSYVGLLICAFGWCLVYRCLIPGLILTAILIIPLVARMNSEERLLQDQFVDEYATYKKRTWRMIPWVY